MNILSIETSCDETGISIIEAEGGLTRPSFEIHANTLTSQMKLHEKYGGVFPSLAKREHSKALMPLLEEALTHAKHFQNTETVLFETQKIADLFVREPELKQRFLKRINTLGIPPIDLIAVTTGPGLEPALWVGVNFARALSRVWKKPIVGVNHMEGHIASVLLEKEQPIINFNALALLISGGHTELVEVDAWGSYTLLGATRDDAVGEAFDKIGRLLGLPYPGGPEVSALAKIARQKNLPPIEPLPRPMLGSRDLDFSFSGLKTAVRYRIRDLKSNLSDTMRMQIARETEDAITQILIQKTEKALSERNIHSLIVAGGVIANTHIRDAFNRLVQKYPPLTLHTPSATLATDNALMIGAAGYLKYMRTGAEDPESLTATGTLEL